MDRRGFLKTLTLGGVAVAAAAREWPFRVFSFSNEVKLFTPQEAESEIFTWSHGPFTVKQMMKFTPEAIQRLDEMAKLEIERRKVEMLEPIQPFTIRRHDRIDSLDPVIDAFNIGVRERADRFGSRQGLLLTDFD